MDDWNLFSDVWDFFSELFDADTDDIVEAMEAHGVEFEEIDAPTRTAAYDFDPQHLDDGAYRDWAEANSDD